MAQKLWRTKLCAVFFWTTLYMGYRLGQNMYSMGARHAACSSQDCSLPDHPHYCRNRPAM